MCKIYNIYKISQLNQRIILRIINEIIIFSLFLNNLTILINYNLNIHKI